MELFLFEYYGVQCSKTKTLDCLHVAVTKLFLNYLINADSRIFNLFLTRPFHSNTSQSKVKMCDIL